MSEQIKCDQCGATVPRGAHEDWIALTRFKRRYREELLAGIGHFRGSGADLCSWKCLATYAAAQPDPSSPPRSLPAD